MSMRHMNMAARRALMRRLVAERLHLNVDVSPWLGEMSVATRHAVYGFRDGVCVNVHCQDTSSARQCSLGRRLLGWLVDENAVPNVSRRWRRGASGILVVLNGNGVSLTMTSPTIHLQHDRASEHAQPYSTVDSMMRIGIPLRRG